MGPLNTQVKLYKGPIGYSGVQGPKLQAPGGRAPPILTHRMLTTEYSIKLSQYQQPWMQMT